MGMRLVGWDDTKSTGGKGGGTISGWVGQGGGLGTDRSGRPRGGRSGTARATEKVNDFGNMIKSTGNMGKLMRNGIHI